MKMKQTPFYKIAFFWIFILALLVTSCQEDEMEAVSSVSTEDNVALNSNLAMLLLEIASNDGSIDDLLDNANCFEVNLPVTITINEVTITIATHDDLALLEEIIAASDLDDDILEFIFPITITLSDYTEIVINNQEEILVFIKDCFSEEESVTDCVDFQYPISFSVFNTDFEVIDTVTITSDEALYQFLESLQNNPSGAVIANLNFPVTLLYENGEVIEVTNNQELEEAILNAVNNCAVMETTFCEEENLDTILQDCFWEITSYNNTTSFSEYLFNFKESDSLQITNNLSVINGQWATAQETNGVVLSLSNLGILEDNLNGEWLIEECMSEVLTLVNGDNTMTLSQNCQEEPLPLCFEDATLIVCDEENTGFGIFDLTEATVACENTEVYGITYYETLADAAAAINPIATPEAYVSSTNPQVIYYRVELIENTNAFEVYEIQLFSEFCCENTDVLLDDLVIYIPFSSETVDLISGYELLNDGQFVEDRSGNPTCAYSFTDSGDLLFLPVTTQNQIVQGDSFSVSLWFKMQNEDPGDLERLFQKGIQLNEGFQLAVYDLNTPMFSDSTFGYGLWDNDWNQEVDVTWTNTDWHHLVITVDQNNTVQLYRDGELRAIDQNSNIDIDSNPLSFFALGHELTGHLDDLRVYKRTLNPTEINELYNLEGDCFTCL